MKRTPATLAAKGAAAKGAPDWWQRLPGDLVFLDLQTTGRQDSDRIVSLGVIRLAKEGLLAAGRPVRIGHYIFDPGKKSHPKAVEAHGHDEWLLRHQEPFATRAGELLALLEGASLLVAPDPEADLPFLRRALKAAGHGLPAIPAYAALESWWRERDGEGDLTEAAATLGLAPAGERRGALEGAWLCMELYLALHTPLPPAPFGTLKRPGISNLLPAPPQPEGPLPRRKRVRGPGGGKAES